MKIYILVFYIQSKKRACPTLAKMEHFKSEFSVATFWYFPYIIARRHEAETIDTIIWKTIKQWIARKSSYKGFIKLNMKSQHQG